MRMQAAAFASLNGVGLALVLPCIQSILADVYAPHRRGLAFGLVLTTGALGEACPAGSLESAPYSQLSDAGNEKCAPVTTACLQNTSQLELPA